MRTFDPDKLDLRTNYHLMISGIVPRPIALVSTVDKTGIVNLAPFSFFNGFGSNPPVVGFSPAYSGRTGKAKDTLINVRETCEFTISMVTLPMMDKMVVTSKEFDKSVDEFIESGLSKRTSDIVRSPGVEESPYILECRLLDIVELGGKKGSGNLILGKIVRFHVSESCIDENGNISPYLFDTVGRLGGSWYTRVKDGIFKKVSDTGIGFERLPRYILNSSILTGRHLSKLAEAEELPPTEPEFVKSLNDVNEIGLHLLCRNYIDNGNILKAWQVVYTIGEKYE